VAELKGINRRNFNTVNRQSFVESVSLHGPGHGNVGSVRSLHGDRVKRRFFQIASNISDPPGTARITEQGNLKVTWPSLGWTGIDEAGHFGELAMVAPAADGRYHAWSVEHLRHPVETKGTTLFPWEDFTDIWDTMTRGKRHSPFNGTTYQPHGQLCALAITSLGGANLRTNLLPFLWPGTSGGGSGPTPWPGPVAHPQIVMCPDPANLARMSDEQIDAWAQDLLVEHGFDGVDLWLLGQEVNASTVRLLDHPACKIARVVMWTDTDRGGPSRFDTTETREYLQRILRATRGTGATLLIEPSFDVSEIPDHEQRVAEFVALAAEVAPGLQGSATWLFGARQHDSPEPLPGDYAAWGDHVIDKSTWRAMCKSTVARARGRPAAQTDRFRTRSGSSREKDWALAEQPDGIRTARQEGVLCSWAYLPDGDHEAGSRPYPNRGEIAAANRASTDDIDDGGQLMARRPGDLRHHQIRVEPSETKGVRNARLTVEDLDKPIIVEEVEFWVGCWPELLNEFGIGFHVNKRNIAEFSGHKHYRTQKPVAPGGGTFSSHPGHPGTGGVYVDRDRVRLVAPLLVRPDDVIEVSWNQHPEHANSGSGGTHFRVLLRGRKP